MLCTCGLVLALTASLPFRTDAVFGTAKPFPEPFARTAQALALEGNRLYVGGRGWLAVYDVGTDPAQPKLLGKTDELATVRQLAVEDGLVAAVARESGVWFVDCRDAAQPKVTGHYPSVSNCTGVDLAGSVCFVGGSRSGIDFIDISDPMRPQLVGNVREEPVESQSVAYRNGYLYSSEWTGKCVSVWDVHDLATPRRTSLAPLASNGDGAWPQGRWLYAPTGWSQADKKVDRPHPGQMGLEIFDLADPAQPKRLSRVDFAYVSPGGVDMWIARASGDLVFVAANCGGLYAVDVTDRSAPKVADRWVSLRATGAARKAKLGSTRPSDCVASVAPGDGVVYVAGPALGAQTIVAKGARREAVRRGAVPKGWKSRPPRPPVSDAYFRWLPSDASLSACVTGLAVKDDTAYAACGAAGLFVLALTADGIREVKRFSLPECLDVSVAGNRLFVAAGRCGFIGYEIVSPTELKEVLRVPSCGARDVYALGDGTRWATFNTTVYDLAGGAAPKPLVNLVHQSRWDKFMCPDLIAGRWTAGNSSLKHFGWADLAATEVKETVVSGYKTHSGTICAFGEKAFVADNGQWAIVEPGVTELKGLRDFPKGGISRGLPRARGSLVALSGHGGVGVWNFSDPQAPKTVATWRVKGFVEAISFWRDRVVLPARDLGVLLPKKGFGECADVLTWSL